MQKVELNIRTAINLQRIPQEKIEFYLDHMNFRLRNRFVCIRNMNLEPDSTIVFGKLVDMDKLSNQLQFHLSVDGLASIQLVTLNPDDVLIFFDTNEDETEFTSCFIYWDEKYTPGSGINLRTLKNVSRLTKDRLEKYLDKSDYMLNGRKAIVRAMQIEAPENGFMPGYFIGFANSELKFQQVSIKNDGVIADISIGRINEDAENDNVLIIYDKAGVNPEFIYWED